MRRGKFGSPYPTGDSLAIPIQVGEPELSGSLTGGLFMEREDVKARIVELLTELSPEDKKWVIETLRSENVIRREAPFYVLEEPHTVGMVICEEAVACRIDVDLKKWMELFRNATYAMFCQRVFDEPVRINA